MSSTFHLKPGKNPVDYSSVFFSLPPVPPDLTGQMRLNGALDSQPVIKKRRGRRKNVEGMDLLFMNKSRVPAVPDQASQNT